MGDSSMELGILGHGSLPCGAIPMINWLHAPLLPLRPAFLLVMYDRIDYLQDFSPLDLPDSLHKLGVSSIFRVAQNHQLVLLHGETDALG